MKNRPFGKLGNVSALTLGGGGLGQLWGKTSREECISTVHDAVESGIDIFDLAPLYGNGEAENVIGSAFNGKPPSNLRFTTKCRVGDTSAKDVYNFLFSSLSSSLKRMKIEYVDIMFLHNQITLRSNGGERITTINSLTNVVAPAFEKLISAGLVKSWGLTGIGEPEALMCILNGTTNIDYIQCITNLLDSPGGLKSFDGPAKPRTIIESANASKVPVMGIRAVQAGALTTVIDRSLPQNHSELIDYEKAAPFRKISQEMGKTPAYLAHQYALSIEGVSTVVLGVKNRQELAECIDAENAGPMDPQLIKQIDKAVGRVG